MKTVSIVIPSYNMEEYLPKNLQNLVKIENIADVEIIVVNDGSTDGTLKIARDFEDTCSSVKVIDKVNGHYGSCINAALKVATGKYFRILDADDWFDTEVFDAFVVKLKNCDADLVVTLRTEWTKKADGSWKTERFPIEGLEYDHIYDARNIRFSDFSKNVEFNMHSMSYKTELLRSLKLELPHGVCYTDMIYCLTPLNDIKDFVIFNLYLYNYYIGREGSSTTNIAIKKNLSHISKVLYIMMNYVDSHVGSTPEVYDNQKRYVKEALNIFLDSIERNSTISHELYNSYFETIRLLLNKHHIVNRKLKKYYFYNWYKKGGYLRFLFWIKVNFLVHIKYW